MARQGLSSLDDVVSANATARLQAYVEEASVRELVLAAASASTGQAAQAAHAPPPRAPSADQTDEFDTLALIESL